MINKLQSRSKRLRRFSGLKVSVLLNLHYSIIYIVQLNHSCVWSYHDRIYCIHIASIRQNQYFNGDKKNNVLYSIPVIRLWWTYYYNSTIAQSIPPWNLNFESFCSFPNIDVCSVRKNTIFKLTVCNFFFYNKWMSGKAFRAFILFKIFLLQLKNAINEHD
jgi:hypothetical protein